MSDAVMVKGKPGRPKKVIDYNVVARLAAIQCTQEEIAAALELSVDTLQRDQRFCGIYKTGIENGKMSLRRFQWKALAEGNTTMLVWLGKQYLGQRDQHHLKQEISGPNGGPIQAITGTVVFDVASLGIKQREQFKALLLKAKAKEVEGESDG